MIYSYNSTVALAILSIFKEKLSNRKQEKLFFTQEAKNLLGLENIIDVHNAINNVCILENIAINWSN